MNRGTKGAWRALGGMTALCCVGCVGVISGPTFDADLPLRATHDAVTLDCVERDGDPQCKFRATSNVRNTGDDAIDAALRYRFVNARQTNWTVDDEEGRLKAPLRVRFDPTQTRAIAARGVVRSPTPFIELPAIRIRHMVLGGEDFTARYQIEYRPSPPELRADDHRLGLDMHYPRTWSVYTRLVDTSTTGDQRTLRRIRPKRRSLKDGRRRVTFADEPSSDGNLAVSVEVPGDLFLNGGPLLALGIGAARGGSVGFRGRVGYEIAVYDFVLVALNAETDASESVVFAPTVELTTPYILSSWWTPTFAIGLGAAAQVAPDAELGVRLQATLAYPIGSIVVTADQFPNSGADVYQLMLQGSL